ncbi:hypothetical protein [Parendozoicomonas sp. Alg238-R29]|uniref:hypothetical protein n=1 Tax=Parendozoicomonas sp. Alg238-R29 TaxID=2993446 RepID=UPI00248E71E9|nr:hypothetical protein [Parendozoicomonas sp. Alg238-R29]
MFYQVSFPQRQVQRSTLVSRLEPVGDNTLAVIVEETPFHPLDYAWPDQPADRGNLIFNDQIFPVVDCLTGAINQNSNQLFIDKGIPVRKGEEGWDFVVVHILEKTPETDALQHESTITLSIDEKYQHQLSIGHTACHFSAMALNKILIPLWRKNPGKRDVLNSPDFDQMAIVSSKIQPGGSRDHYRLGKTIRKKGLQSAELMEHIAELLKKAESQANSWLRLEAEIQVRCDGPSLTDRRYWQCNLGEHGDVAIPCGGTHASNMKELGKVSITYEPAGDMEFVMVTRTNQ